MHQRMTYVTSRWVFSSCILISDIEKFSLRGCWIQIVKTPVMAAKMLFSAQQVIQYLACTCTSDTIKQHYSVFWEASITYITD